MAAMRLRSPGSAVALHVGLSSATPPLCSGKILVGVLARTVHVHPARRERGVLPQLATTRISPSRQLFRCGITKSLPEPVTRILNPCPHLGARRYSRNRCPLPTLPPAAPSHLRPPQRSAIITHHIRWAEENERQPCCIWRIRRCMGRNVER